MIFIAVRTWEVWPYLVLWLNIIVPIPIEVGVRRGGGGGGGGGVVVILGALQRVLALGGHEAGDPVVGIHGAAGSSSSAGRRPDLRVSSRLLPLVSSRRRRCRPAAPLLVLLLP